MAKVDEQASVPPVDDAARERLAAALIVKEVAAASLIGSQATGTGGPLSDIDVAVWLRPELSADEPATVANELAVSAIGALGTSEVDLVIAQRCAAPGLPSRHAGRPPDPRPDSARAHQARAARAARLPRHRRAPRDTGGRHEEADGGREIWSTLSASKRVSSDSSACSSNSSRRGERPRGLPGGRGAS